LGSTRTDVNSCRDNTSGSYEVQCNFVISTIEVDMIEVDPTDVSLRGAASPLAARALT
jgi:hypothetical protein